MNQKTVIDLVKGLPKGTATHRLYYQGEQPNTWAAQAVFQSLSMYSKVLLMRVIHIDCSFSLEDFTRYMKPAGEEATVAVIDELTSLRILEELRDDSDYVMDVEQNLLDPEKIDYSKLYRVSDSFRLCFLYGMANPATPWEIERGNVPHDPNPPTLEEIEQNAVQKWNKMLGLIVGIVNHTAFERKVVVPFVLRFNLMALRDQNRPDVIDLTITNKGYEYMLKDYASQVWDFVVESCQQPNKDLVEALSFLFMLSFAENGVGYPTTALTKAGKSLMFELSELGIIYVREHKSPDGKTSLDKKWFYPTRSAVKIVFGSEGISGATVAQVSNNATNSAISLALQQQKSGQLQIIVETNLQVTAYYFDPLHVALLRLFVDVRVQLPNMILGRLSRDVAKNAYRMGMKAAQIIDFLTFHAHPIVRGKPSVLPSNAVDQLVLWEKELHRIETTPAIVFDASDYIEMTYDRFQDLVDDLRSASLWIWSKYENDRKMIACHPGAEDMITRFIKEKLHITY